MRAPLLGMIALLFFACRAKTTERVGGVETRPKDSKETQASEGFSAVATEELKTVRSFYETVMKVPFNDNLNGIPVKADAAFIPYSGYYYYERSGGTNEGGALAKYDKAFGTTAVAWEEANHYTAVNAAGADWNGHCTGWSAASSRLAEPPSSVTMKGQTFTPQDIKALLAETFMSAYFIPLGGVRCKKDNLTPRPFSRSNAEQMDACEDVNPGSFILALGNTVAGRDRLPMIMDESIGVQVWNFPIYHYECTNCVQNKWTALSSAKQAKEIIAGAGVADGNYQFNNQATKWYDIKLRVTYTKGSAAGETIGGQTPESKVYRFIVETDDAGRVLGGEWAHENQLDHPDMLRLALDPVRGNGKREFANDQIDPDIVMELWRASWRAAGKPTMYEGKKLPTWETSWGQQNDYTVAIDGLMSGAAFLQAENKVNINVSSDALAGTKVHVALNGAVVKDMSASKGKNELTVKLKAGMNTLSLVWEKSGTNEQQDFKFYAIP